MFLTDEQLKKPRKSVIFGVLTVLLGVCLVGFGGSLDNEFVWIDHEEIEGAAYRVESISDFQKLWTMSLDQYLDRNRGLDQTTGGYWRPVYAISISIDWWMWQATPYAYRLENILWHWIVVCGLFFCGWSLSRMRNCSLWVPFIAAFTFAIHPLGAHSVTWISGRKDSLCAAFVLISFYNFLQLVCRNHNSIGANLRRLAVILFFALSVLSKEVTYVFPAILIITCWLLWNDEGFKRKTATITTLIVTMVAIGLFALRAQIVGAGGLSAEYPSESLSTNLAMSSHVFWHYVSIVMAPHYLTVADTFPITEMSQEGIYALVGLIVFFCLSTWFLYKRWLVAFGLMWWMILLVPASGLVPLRHFCAERYLYPASWGIMFSACVLFNGIFRHRIIAIRVVGVGFAMLVCSVFLLKTWSFNKEWANDHELFSKSVQTNTNYVEGLIALAKNYLDHDEPVNSIIMSKQAIETIRINQGQYVSYYSPWIMYTNYGLALVQDQDFVQAESAFEQALRARPKNAQTLYQLGICKFNLGQFGAAEEYFNRSLEIMPNDRTLGELALAKTRLGKLEEAVEILAEVIDRNPEDNLVRNTFASTLLVLKRYRAAESEFKLLVSKEPKNGIAFAKLAWAQFELAKDSDAKSNLRRALELEPESPTIRQIEGLLRQKGLLISW